MILHLKPWAIAHNAFGDKAFIRRAYFADGDFVSEGDIAIMERYNLWGVEKPFTSVLLNLEGDGALTPESLMFKIDLYLVDDKRYVVGEPFIFPENDY